MRRLIASVLALWFGLVILLAANGAFVRPPHAPPIPILFGALVPLAVFLAAYLGSTRFRDHILALDLPLITAIQAWRAGGLAFVALSANGVLPRLFAWPAGYGDIAIGVTAPWVLMGLIRRPGFAAGRAFVIWNLLGILDLVVAVTAGVLSTGIVPGLVGDVTTAPMSQLPLVLIPAFLVPLFVMLHLASLFQARRNASAPASTHRIAPGLTHTYMGI